ncbi:MAG: NINE protein [Candidatus Nanopelagicales bacterium]
MSTEQPPEASEPNEVPQTPPPGQPDSATGSPYGQPYTPPTQPQSAQPQYEQPQYAQPGPPVAYQQPNYDPRAKSRMAAGLLGIFLGGFGVHRFYLGYTTIGIVQILVTVVTCGIGAIWGLIEGIMILAQAQSFRTDAQGVPLRE